MRVLSFLSFGCLLVVGCAGGVFGLRRAVGVKRGGGKAPKGRTLSPPPLLPAPSLVSMFVCFLRGTGTRRVDLNIETSKHLNT